VTKLLLIILLLASSPVKSAYKDWTEKEKNLWKHHLVLQVVDTYQTWKVIECQNNPIPCRLEEQNPLLGRFPSKGRLIASKAIGNYALYKAIDNSFDSKRERRIKITLVIFTIVIINNEIQYEKRF
jgi:hypothetical protein|tara:strand:- start:145 stop:522 length:378 start_codon:yes stop_codon:yes gene_type:complete